jgi:alkylation response protein AidB-like acyl-CoA dehydrogenase
MKFGPLTHLTDDEQMFVKEVEKFAATVVKPKVHEMDESEIMAKSVIDGLFEMGLMGIEVPEEFGGAGGSFFMSILAIEALAKVDPSVSVLCDVQNTLVNNIFLRWGTPEQKKKYLNRLCSKDVGSYCLTEPNSGSDAFAMKARAYDEGTHWRLEGKKVFITNAKEANIFVVFANVNPEAGYKGITAFVCERGTPGFSVGKKEIKLGIRASSTCEVILDNVKIPKDNVVGEIGKGYKISIETLNEGRIGIAAQMLGLAQGAHAGAMLYARQRQQFGKELRDFQGMQFDLAEMATQIEAAKLMVYNAARLKDSGQSFVKEAAMAKLYVGNVAEEVASRALEVYGGYGFIKEFPAEKFYRDAKIGKLYEGTSNMQKATIFKLIDGQMK